MLDLKGSKKGSEQVVRVNNAVDLKPVGEPKITRDSPEVGREPVPPGAEAAVAQTRDVIQTLRETGFFEYVEPVIMMEASRLPNDPYMTSNGIAKKQYDDLWGLKRIQAPAAWNTITDASTITIAVIDTGVDFGHRDLQNTSWQNPGETGADAQGRDKKTNGLDDDANGYIDDWRGWDFYNNDNDPADDYGHGTHVAGTIAAVGNNGTDISGVLWQAKIMSLKFLPAGGGGTSADGAAAIQYAADNGARLINASWGGRGMSVVIHDAIEYADSKGVLVVAAGGNAGCNLNYRYCWYSPALEEKVMAVGASTPHDSLASFSNYGNKLELVAPGGEWASDTYNILSLRARGTDMGTPVTDQLTLGAGTSMAAPHVTGVAGMVWAQHPEWTPAQVRTHLQQTADDLGVTGRDKYYGYGLVNAARAVGQPALLATITSPEPGAFIKRAPQQKVEIKGSVGGPPFKRYIVEAALLLGASPAWTTIQDSTFAVNNGTLATWTPPAQPIDGVFRLRLTVSPGTAEQVQILREVEFEKPLAVFINNDDEATATRDVTLTVWGPSSGTTVPQLRIRNSGDPWGPWQALAESKPWQLPAGDGLKKVEAQLKYGTQELDPMIDSIVLSTGGTVNRPPKVEAGPALEITLAQTATLDGTVSDDSRPTPPGAVTTTWSKLTGPGTVTFVNAAATDTTATFSATGVYQLQLSASDGEYTVTDFTSVRVEDNPKPLSYLSVTVTRPRFDERRLIKGQDLPLTLRFQHLKTDTLRCLTLRLDGRAIAPQEANISNVPAC